MPMSTVRSARRGAAAAAEDDNAEELLVWPWTGILATAGAGADTLALHARDFATIATTSLQEHTLRAMATTHFLVLHFARSWSGLRAAMALDCRFRRSRRGRREWQERGGRGGVYGWMAGGRDLAGEGAVGRFLRERGRELRSVADVDAAAGVATPLAGIAEYSERRLRYLEGRCEEIVVDLETAEEEKRVLLGELQELRNFSLNILPEMNREIYEVNEQLRIELDTARKELELKSVQIEELQDERIKLGYKLQQTALERSSLEMTGRAQKTNGIVQMLTENQKREGTCLQKRILQLEKQLERKQQLEFAMQQLNMKLQEGKHAKRQDCEHPYSMMANLNKKLEQERRRLADLNLEIIARERKSNDELQDARQELIRGSADILNGRGRSSFKIKRIGELDQKPFKDACKKKDGGREAAKKARKLHTIWQQRLERESWQPFKIIRQGCETKEVLDKDDPTLRSLHRKHGNSVCNAVEKAYSGVEGAQYNCKTCNI